MSIWKEIKKTINSTVSTSNFKPLDQIIEGQRTLAASDSVMAILISKQTQVKDWTSQRFTAKVGGSVRFLLEASPVNGTSYFDLKAYNSNGSVVGQKSIFINDAESDTGIFNLSLDINVTKDETYYFAIEPDSYDNTYIISAKIGANVVDTNLIKVGV